MCKISTVQKKKGCKEKSNEEIQLFWINNISCVWEIFSVCVWIYSAQQCRFVHVSTGQSFFLAKSQSGLLSHQQLLVLVLCHQGSIKTTMGLALRLRYLFTTLPTQHNTTQTLVTAAYRLHVDCIWTHYLLMTSAVEMERCREMLLIISNHFRTHKECRGNYW